jgi:hypothetical protein
MPSVNPNSCKYAETNGDDRIADFEVVENFAESKDDIRDIVGPEYWYANPCEMKTI